MRNDDYLKALKREADRDRAWRKTQQGAFESAFLSIDAHVAKFDDPSKIAAFSDRGAGEARIFARYAEEDRSRRIADALSRLSPKERRFAYAVLDGATWRELDHAEKSCFYRRLKKICKKLGEKQPPTPSKTSL